MESFTKPKNKNKQRVKRTIFTNKGATEGLDKTFFKKMPIYWAAENFFTFQTLQPVRVIWESLGDSERPNPQGFKFAVFALILFRRIPFQYQVSYLEPLLLGLPIEDLLDFLLMVLDPVQYFLPSLLYLY